MANLRMYNNIKANLSSDANLKGNITVGSVNVTGADMTNYYDKEDVNTLLEGKSDVDHDHIIKNGIFKYTLQEAYDHLLRQKITEMQANQLIYNYAAPIEHDHIVKTGLVEYNTQEAFDMLKNEVSKKANKNHIHDQYLTEHQDISGKADITYVDNAINTALNGIESELDEIIGDEEV